MDRNRRRDRANRQALRKMGFGVWRFWEHDLKGKRMVRTQVTLERRLKARLDHRVSRQKITDGKVPARRPRDG